jgi:hypothetical protein
VKLLWPDIVDQLQGFNEPMLAMFRKGIARTYDGFNGLGLDLELDCEVMEDSPSSTSEPTAAPSKRYRRATTTIALAPITPLPNGQPFATHAFADQWLSELSLRGDDPVTVTYQEVETVNSPAQTKRASVPLRNAVTQGFLSAHQSKDVYNRAALSPRAGWTYPHISHMALDFSSLRVNGMAPSPALEQQLRRGIAPGYRSTARPVATPITTDAQGQPLTIQQQQQIMQLQRLNENEEELTRLFATLPTLRSVLEHQLISAIRRAIPASKFRDSLFQVIDPAHWYVNQFSTDASGTQTLTSSKSFTEVMQEALLNDGPPTFTLGSVGFFSRPDTLEQADSVFASPVDAAVLQAMKGAFYVAHPTTSDTIKEAFRQALARFHSGISQAGPLATTPSAATQTVFARLLYQRFLRFVDLFKADRPPVSQLSLEARRAQYGEDRLVDIITTDPTQAARNQLMTLPIPKVYAVMLDMGNAAAQKWPAAMVIKQIDQPILHLYSMEGGLQRFASFQVMYNDVRPTYEGEERRLLNITSEITANAFEVAATDLLNLQGATLEKVLDAPENATISLSDFGQNAEEALNLPQLSLTGPLVVRQQTLIEYGRPNAYKAATLSQQQEYRRLEAKVFEATYELGRDIPTLTQFARQQIKQYLQRTVHPSLEADPDATTVRLFFGSTDNPRQSATTTLTQLVLDNKRPSRYPTPLEVTPTYLLDKNGQRIRNPANGLFILLTLVELATLVKTIDAGAAYETLLRERMNQAAYKSAWQAAYLATMQFKAYEAALRGDEVFKTRVTATTNQRSASLKVLALWLDALVQEASPPYTPSHVNGKRVQAYGLVLGGSVGSGGGYSNAGAVSIDGALVFTDQPGPEIKGLVGVYFPDSPEGNDFHEFSDLADGIGGLLRQEPWREYFRSRMSITDPGLIERVLGLRTRPLIRGVAYSGKLLDALHRHHVEFQSAHANERSTTNQELADQSQLLVITAVVEGIMDVITMVLAPGYRTVTSALRLGAWMLRTGGVRLHQLRFIAAYYKGRVPARMAVSMRGQASFMTATARQQGLGSVSTGLPLETSVYNRYAVTNVSLIQGLTPNAAGFYRTAAGVFIRQPDGVVLRVHDHTRSNATEANLVDPTTGLGIRSSTVTRSTVARMPNGEWRAVGFGRGGGRKRPANTSPQPSTSGTTAPAVACASICDSIRTPGVWNAEIMDLVPQFITRLPSWPQNRSLVIITQFPDSEPWSVRFTPGEPELRSHVVEYSDTADTDIVLIRTSQNHYDLRLRDRTVVAINPDGDCFFNATATGLNEGGEGRFTMQGLRNDVARYVDEHPELNDFMVQHSTPTQQALYENGPTLVRILDEPAVLDLTRIVSGYANPHQLFQPVLSYLNRYVDWVGRRTLEQAQLAALPPEVLHNVGRFLSPRSPASLMPENIPYKAKDKLAVRQFFEQILLEPVEQELVDQLLNDRYLLLSRDVSHIMLEYGVTARQLLDHHPTVDDAFVLYDEAVHGNLDVEALEEKLDGAYLVDRDNLDDTAGRLKAESNKDIDDDVELFEQFKYYENAEDTIHLLREALRRFPVLHRRLDILLASPIIDAHLGGLLDVSLITRWLRNPAISDQRLQIITDYTRTRYNEVITMESIDIEWMRFFTDQNLRAIITHQRPLVEYMKLLKGVYGDAEDIDVPSVVRYFSAPGHAPSDTRVDILLNTPNLGQNILNLPQHHIRRIWEDLVGPYFSDNTIRHTFAQPGAFDSVGSLALAIQAGLSSEDARANQIIRDLYTVTQSQAQRYLYNFNFPTNRPGHSRLDFARHMESHFQIPEWTWTYARPGVTAESLKSFQW